MNFTPALVGFALYILIWEKLPEWGNWFNWILQRLPKPLQTLYAQWRCPYCVGFWMALALHGATGLWTLPALANLPGFWGSAAPLVGWFLDALATATLILICKLTLEAIGLPAMKAHSMRQEFMRKMAEEASK
ncbi:hypothetical protein O4H49_02420 [Kiloniella laminariae]|uniref:DUF1360 domain-containing protein n=1 Tax=Kiloniella laminariae TaxID=454162 RepID=A0ABT4LFB0_9PROT|nr:hypothetical protein [Kiloniella laminariae]MCZ4279615.1 hypothetical protein [Kiloniella laminariae]